jgi:hypothetical protein
MSPCGTGLTLDVLPHCLDERTFVWTRAPTEFDPQQTFLRLVPVPSSYREHVREAHDNGVSLKHAVPRRNPELFTGCNPAID